MKYIKHLLFAIGMLVGLSGCEEDIPNLGQLATPQGLSLEATVSDDGSGVVNFRASASEAMTFHYYLGIADNERPTISANGSLTYNYRSSGAYLVRVVAFGAGGQSTTAAIEIEVQVDFQPPSEVISTLTNGSSRTWVWKKSVPGHLGVGPEFYDDGNIGDAPIWYQAAPFEKEAEGCLYTDELTFSVRPDGNVTMELNNNGVTYFHVDEAADALGVPRPQADQCFDFPSPGVSTVAFFEATTGIPNSTNIGFELTGSGFMSYFLNSSTYEILELTSETLTVRTVQDVDGFRLAWYQTFEPTDAAPPSGDGGSFELIWEDNFDQAGAPNPANWGYDLGTGADGWGNQELQYYTDRTDNVIVEDGLLKITAKREAFAGSQFTSARILTKDKFEFTYGKVEVRAKLPEGVGTWPAIWMLGADFETNIWPACGEIDIMEHVGRDLGRIHGSLHSPSSFGATVNTGSVTVSTATTDFHVYSVEWSAEKIDFFVDGTPYYSYNPANKNADTWPFDKDFFIILNVAMGGTFGGNVEGGFSQGTMEVDYVKVYQRN